MMKYYALLWGITMYCIAPGCAEKSASDHETRSHEAAETTHSHDESTGHDTDHSHHDANAYMNQRPFEDLVANFESEERTAWQKPDAVIASLGDLKGKTVVDIGAGSGYFVFRLAPLVGKVVGVDIDERFLNHMKERKSKLSLDLQSRIEIRPTDEQTPRLGRAEADIVLIVNTYHHIQKRIRYFERLKGGLKEGAKLVIIDFKEGELPVGPPEDHKISLDLILKELAQAGYANVRVDSDLLEYQHIITAQL